MGNCFSESNKIVHYVILLGLRNGGILYRETYNFSNINFSSNIYKLLIIISKFIL